MKNKLLLLLVVLALTGCSKQWKIGKCTQWGVCKAVKDSTHIVIKDSTYFVPIPYHINSDTAWLEMLIECDNDNHAVIREKETINGKYIKLLQDVKSGKFTVTAYISERIDTVYAEGKTVTVTEYKEVIQQTEINRLKWWQIALMVVGAVSIVIFIVLLIRKLR